jgi:hypothetical protein
MNEVVICGMSRLALFREGQSWVYSQRCRKIQLGFGIMFELKQQKQFHAHHQPNCGWTVMTVQPFSITGPLTGRR